MLETLHKLHESATNDMMCGSRQATEWKMRIFFNFILYSAALPSSLLFPSSERIKIYIQNATSSLAYKSQKES